jgi:hypothetical protein
VVSTTRRRGCTAGPPRAELIWHLLPRALSSATCRMGLR